MDKYSKYKWNQNEFDALVSFAYNIGSIDGLTSSGSRSKDEKMCIRDRGNTDDVQCIPVTPECIRELGMGMKKGEEPSDSVKKLKECVLEYVLSLIHI